MRPSPPARLPVPADMAHDPRAEADALLEAGRWADAAEAYARVTASTDDPLAWDGLARAVWWLDDGARCLDAREQAHRAALAAGDVRTAAAAAGALGYDAALFGQGAAVALGWLGRARSLLDGVTPRSVEHGWLGVREAELALQVTHRPHVALAAATDAAALGRELGRPDLVVVAEGLLGLAEVATGRAREGLERLDAAVAGALAGDVDDVVWVGKVCCWLVVACRKVQDLPRALEWCERVEALCRDRDLAPLFGACRIQFAAIRLESGHWIEAERELVAALDRMRGSRRATRTDAVVQLGHLRRRQDRLEEAEALYAQAGPAPEATAGRALVRLAAGDAAAAWALAAAVLDDVPREDRLARSAVLLPVVRCAVAAGHRDVAEAAAAELVGIAADLDRESVHGRACAAAALAGDPAAAPASWRAAARAFHRAGLPVEEADARVAVARLVAADEPTVAADEVRAAVSVLEPVDAPERLAAARALLDGATTGADAPALTPRETEVLRLVAAGRTNAQIARELVVSTHTVHRHVSNILTRLDEPSRAAAATRAVREGLI